MSRIDSPEANAIAQPESATASDRVARWGVVTCAVIGLGFIAVAWSARATLQTRIAELEERTTRQLGADVRALEDRASALSSDFDAATNRLAVTTKELENAREAAEVLRQEQRRTARTAASNTQGLENARHDIAASIGSVTMRVTGLASEVRTANSTLTSTRSELAAHRQEVNAATAKLSDGVAMNASAVSELRRKGERDVVEFDLRKPSRPESWTVGDIRVELRDTNVRQGKYDVVLHVDDRRIERKQMTVNQPVPFLVGADKVRYELVVTSVDRDRIRGYLRIPRDRALAAERRVAGN